MRPVSLLNLTWDSGELFVLAGRASISPAFERLGVPGEGRIGLLLRLRAEWEAASLCAFFHSQLCLCNGRSAVGDSKRTSVHFAPLVNRFTRRFLSPSAPFPEQLVLLLLTLKPVE